MSSHTGRNGGSRSPCHRSYSRDWPSCAPEVRHAQYLRHAEHYRAAARARGPLRRAAFREVLGQLERGIPWAQLDPALLRTAALMSYEKAGG